MDTEGKILPAGQSGELCTRGTQFKTKYNNLGIVKPVFLAGNCF